MRVAMDAVDGQHDHDGEVGDEQRRVKRVPVVEALEGLVGGLHCFEVVEETVLGGEGEKRGEPRGQRPEEDAGEAGNGIDEGHKRGEQGVSLHGSDRYHCMRCRNWARGLAGGTWGFADHS
jgi:hypothetical protein